MFKYDMVLGRRVGRIGFGVVLLLGASNILARLGPPHPLAPFDGYEPVLVPHVAANLAATWVLAFGVYAVLARMLRGRPCLPRQLGVASLAVPGIGISLLLPLTLHLPIALAFNSLGEGFDRWAYLSRDVVG